MDPRIQERLARRIRGEHAAQPKTPRLSATVDKGQAPLSFTQEAIWLHCLLDDAESTVYNLATCLRVRGAVDICALTASLKAVVARHDVLRTSISSKEGRPWQVRHQSMTVEPEFLDLSVMASNDDVVRSLRIRLEDAVAKPFDLSKPPLFRFCIFRLPGDETALLIVAHHLIFDGWSFGIVLQELVHHYACAVSGSPTTAPSLAIQFADYASAQRSVDQAAAQQASLTYWKQALVDFVPKPSLVPDRVVPNRASFACDRSTFWLGELEVRALSGAAKALGVSDFAFFSACLFAALYRFGGESDLALVTPVSSRDAEETQLMVGPLTGLVLLRAQMHPGEPFAALARRVHTGARKGVAHQDAPFERILGLASGAERGRSAWRPDLALYWDDTPVPDAFAVEGLMGYREAVPNQRTGYPLTVIVQSNLVGAKTLVSIEYAAGMYREQTIEHFSNSLRCLMAAAVRSVQTPVEMLPAMEYESLERVVRKPNATDRAWPKRRVHELILDRARLDPGATATISGDQKFDYWDLGIRVAALTQRILAHGVQREALVGICAGRSADIVVAVLAVMNAGAAYLPLDDRLPAARLAFMLHDSGASLVLVDEGSQSNQVFNGLSRLRIDECAIAVEPATLPVPSVGEQDLAYVIYTSGSTGRPKGVMVSHGALSNVVQDFAERMEIRRGRAMVFSTSLSFDIFGLEMFTPLVSGGCVIVSASDVPAIRESFESARVEFEKAPFMQATPTTWAALLDAGWRPEREQLLLCGGERLPPDLLKRLLQSGARPWNVYGPTEMTIWSTCARCESYEVDIGLPIANTRAYVLDEGLRPVPPQAVGDLYLGGDGVARGYWRNPSLTAERFIPSPFETGSRLYRTGDRARWIANGRLEYVGRVDDQVKIRGHRVELAEIESVAMSHAAIGAAVAVFDKEAPGGGSITLHVIPRPGVGIDIHALQTLLRAELPAYMQPAQVNVLEQLPVTSSGKVDRQAIARVGGRPWVARVPFVPAGTETERVLVAIWAESIGIPADAIGIDTDFFDLGGHSLIAMRALAHIRDKFRIRLPLEAVFDKTTVRQLARHLDLHLWLVDEDRSAAAESGKRDLVEGML